MALVDSHPPAGSSGPGALLSPEASVARCRPLRSWTASERARVCEVARGALSAWREAWGVKQRDALGPVTCDAPAGQAPAEGSSEMSRFGGASGAWMAVGGRARGLTGEALALSELSLALFGDGLPQAGTTSPGGDEAPGGQGGVAAEVVRAAWQDLQARLATALGLGAGGEAGSDGARSALGGPWSGALVLAMRWWEVHLRVLLPGDALGRLLPSRGAATSPPAPRAALVPLWRAVAGRTTRLRVEMQPFEIELGAVHMLRVGDVVRTAQPLDEAVHVALEWEAGRSAQTVCAGFLGKVGSARAIELVPATHGAGVEAERRGLRAGEPGPRKTIG